MKKFGLIRREKPRMPDAILEITDEVNVKFIGIPKEILEEAQRELTYYVPGYMHMPTYKIGRWDGRIRLLSLSGKTYLNLIEYVMPIFERHGYNIIIDDLRRDWNDVAEKIEPIDETIFSDHQWDDGTPITLRDYQVLAVNKALESGQCLLEMSTGSGKTLSTAAISKVYAEHGNVIVIVPNIDLAIQTQALFNRVGLDAGIWYSEMKDARDITISTWQSLDHFPELMASVVCVIVDETHQAKAATLSAILTGPAANVPFRFGCTGTIPKEDIWQQQIKGILGPVAFQLKAWQLQSRGVLASSEVIQLEFNDRSNPKYVVDEPYFEDWADQINWFFGSSDRVDMIAEIIKTTAEDEGNVLVLVPYKKHGIALQERLAGSMRVDGDVRGKKRLETYKLFGSGDNGILIATFGVASTGIDIPRIHAMCMIEPGKKFEKIIQSVGRGLRRGEDKDHVVILDIAGNQGFSKKHAASRRKLYKEARIPCVTEVIEYANS